ncbi:MAG: TrkA C-terminal domain-containing protein [Candidatus Izemoplasmatales bacterium]|nr:TrkA C-terminal domain-containing protein [Candidatus Izemoplasmatales bacterium]
MGINALILMGLSIILVYVIFIEIFTIIFRLTGLTIDKARFQVISLFTNSGFTTQEAELIVNSRIRRKIANVTMLSGFILNVTVISVLVNVFITLGSAQSSDILKFFLFIGGFFIIVFILKKLNVFEYLFRGFVEKITNRVIYGSGTNIVEVLDHVGKNSIAQVQVINLPEVLENKTLEKSDIRSTFSINVLAIIRGGETNANVTKDDVIIKDDKVIVFGKVQNIKKLFIKQQ